MTGINKAIIIGRLGKDPEQKAMPNGKAVVNFSVATSETWKDKQTGDKREKTEWHNCVAFDKLAEIIGQYCKKGSQVFISGKLQTRSWEKDGQKHYATEIIASEMQMLDSRVTDDQSRPQSKDAGRQDHTPDDFDDPNIPF